jgi:hypothetical protein
MKTEKFLLALLIALPAVMADSVASAATTLPSIEEYWLRSYVITACHSPETDEDRTYDDLGEAVGRETFFRIFGELNIADPTDIVANGYKAEELFRQRTLQAVENAKKQVQEKGCAELERLTAPQH